MTKQEVITRAKYRIGDMVMYRLKIENFKRKKRVWRHHKPRLGRISKIGWDHKYNKVIYQVGIEKQRCTEDMITNKIYPQGRRQLNFGS